MPTRSLRLGELPTWLLSQASLRAHRILQQRLAEAGVRGHHVRVLAALGEHGPLPQTTIGSLAALDRGDLSVALDELAALDAIERAPDPGDRRRKVVRLTASGDALLAALAPVMAAVQADVLAPLSEQEREALIAALRRLQP